MFVPLTPVRCMHRAADLFGDKTGVVCGSKQFTYTQFAERCERLATALPRHGIERGDRVAWLSLNTHKLLEGYFGILQAGAIVMPMNVRLSPPEMVNILNHSGAKMLIFEKDFAPLMETFRAQCPGVERYVGADDATGADLTYEELLACGRPERADIFAIDENSIAELFYTSGSTGTPKGVALSHRTIYLHGMSVAMLTREAESAVDLHTIPLFHANGWGYPQAATMLGLRQVMVRRFDPVSVLGLIQEHRATLMALVPTMANALLNLPNAGGFDVSSMRDIQIGGAAASPELVERVSRMFPNALCIAGYGLTETAPVLCYARPKEPHADDDPQRFIRQAKTGWPVVGVSVRVVDVHGNDVPKDGKSIGEIIAMGDHVMDGYFREEAATKAVMSGPWLHTGDMAVWDADGWITIVDRSKEIIISGGENISSLEIEKAIYAHPAVFECAVVAAPDEKWGEVPVAILVLKPDQALTEQDLLAFLGERLGRFKLPRRFEFRDEPLPKSGTGKIRKMVLREKFWQGHSKRVHG